MNRIGQDLKKLRQKPPNKEDQQFWKEGGTAMLNLDIWGEWKSSNIGALFEKCGSEEWHLTYLKYFTYLPEILISTFFFIIFSKESFTLLL